MILHYGFFKKLALDFTILLFGTKPTARTKQQLSPFFYIYINLYISDTKQQAK